MGCIEAIGLVDPLPQARLRQGQNQEQEKEEVESEESEYSEPDLSLPPLQRLAQIIIKKFRVAGLLKKKLSKVAHTSDQLRQVIEAILSVIQQLQTGESQEQRQQLNRLLKKFPDLGNKDKLYYHKVGEMLKEKLNGKPISPESYSKIYHQIANFKKNQQINEEKPNKYDIWCVKKNQYQELNNQQLDEVVLLEAVGEKIEQFGVSMKMKMDSIEKESENIIRLLAECLCRYEKDISSLKYDLSAEEVMKSAQISRDACKYHENGTVLLFIYLIRSCFNLESKKESVKGIEKKMESALKQISAKYPPGKGLSDDQKNLEPILKKLTYKDQFSHKPSPLDGQDSKQSQLERIIIQYATKAKNNRRDFEQLVRETCFNLAIQTKIGLKLNPNNPNKKAVIRIKEKMLFDKTQVIEKLPKNSIKQTLSSQEEDYRKRIDQLLNEKNQVLFKISDMVRGRCVFLDINDIILTIEQIKAFIQNDQKKRFRITEIQSRFTNQIPISDVTLKIALNQDIVAELQLTIQANAAAYNFAHKVYQLQRSKVFSKLKITHNYFEQFTDDFKELSLKAIELATQSVPTQNIDQESILDIFDKLQEGNESLSSEERYSLISAHSSSISKYIDLSGTSIIQFDEALINALKAKGQNISGLRLSTDEQLQSIMIPLFNMEMGSWLQTLGKQIDKILSTKHLSALLKATLVYFFFKKFDLSKELIRMIHFFPTYHQKAKEKQWSWKNYTKFGHQYMEIYLQEMFSVRYPFEFANKTARIFNKTVQLQNIRLMKDKVDEPSQLFAGKFVLEVITEEYSPETVSRIMNYLRSYLTAIEEAQLEAKSEVQINMTKAFQNYFKWLMKILEKEPKLDTGIVKHEAILLDAELLMKNNQMQKAKQILQDIKNIFKQNEEHVKWLECQLLLAECQASKKQIKPFIEYYRKQVAEKANALGLDLRGKIVANTQWRIYKHLIKNTGSKEEKKYLEETHLKKALTESSRTEGVHFVRKMFQAEKNDHDMIEKIKPITNETVSYIMLKGLQGLSASEKSLHCQAMSMAKWPNLTTLALSIKDNSQMATNLETQDVYNWPKVIGGISKTQTYQAQNDIADDGCRYLTKTNWVNLSIVDLSNNKIGNAGCQSLCQVCWKKIKKLQISYNNIGNDGAIYLSKADWKDLSYLSISDNEIGDKGIYNLGLANWRKLKMLHIYHNRVSDTIPVQTDLQIRQRQSIWYKTISPQKQNMNKLTEHFKKMYPLITVNWFVGDRND